MTENRIINEEGFRDRGRGRGDVRSFAIAFSLLVLAFNISTSGIRQYLPETRNERSQSASETTSFASAAAGTMVALSSESGATKVTPNSTHTKQFTSFEDMEAYTSRILGPDSFGNGCPAECGCPQTPVDCPQHYQTQDVITSATVLLDTNASIRMASKLHHLEASRGCLEGKENSARGGWCLGRRPPAQENEPPLKLPDGREIVVPWSHVNPSDRIGMTLEELFRTERITSVSDFGAGVGQYGVYLKNRMPDLIYRGYDGAGDIEAYTSGFLTYSDLTLPARRTCIRVGSFPRSGRAHSQQV